MQKYGSGTLGQCTIWSHQQKECTICDIKIDTANGSASSVTHIGKYKGNVLWSNGKTKKIVMKNVKVVPGLVKNLFSLSTVMRNDWDLLTETRNNIKILKIKKGNINMSSTKRYLKMQMEVIWWECRLNLPRVKKQKNQNEEKTQKSKKLEND